MKTVDLIKEIKETKTQKSLLIEAYDILEKDSSEEIAALNWVGLGYSKNYEIERCKNLQLKYEGQLVHRSQLRKIAHRYGLVLARAERYHGSVEASVGRKILDFKEKFGKGFDYRDFKVLAPESEFTFPTDIDPLLVCDVGNDMFYIIAKWGKDLSVTRRIRVVYDKISLYLMIAATIVGFVGFLSTVSHAESLVTIGNDWYWIVAVAAILFMGWRDVALHKQYDPDNWYRN